MPSAASPDDVLAQVPLLAGLKRRDLKRLASAMKERTFPTGANATVEGEGGVGFFIVVEGTASVRVGDTVVNELGPGDWFGEKALLNANQRRTATVTATSDLRCMIMTSWVFRPFLEANPDVAWQILSTMAQRPDEAPDSA
jgi:CRP/FNR family transcriptional regulator, cyclic AMP receptor protein